MFKRDAKGVVMADSEKGLAKDVSERDSRLDDAQKSVVETKTERNGENIDRAESQSTTRLEKFNSWRETLYLLSNPANAAHLRRSIAEAKKEKISERELLEA